MIFPLRKFQPKSLTPFLEDERGLYRGILRFFGRGRAGTWLLISNLKSLSLMEPHFSWRFRLFWKMEKGRGMARIAPIVLEGRRGSISRPQGRKRVWHRRKHRSAIAESRSAAMGWRRRRWWREKSRGETRNAAGGCFSYAASAFSGDFWKWRRCSVFLGSERGSSRGETRGEEERKGESVRKTRGCWERGKIFSFFFGVLSRLHFLFLGIFGVVWREEERGKRVIGLGRSGS